MILPNSPTEQALIRRVNALLAALSVDERVIETAALHGMISALGRAEVLQHRRDREHRAGAQKRSEGPLPLEGELTSEA